MEIVLIVVGFMLFYSAGVVTGPAVKKLFRKPTRDIRSVSGLNKPQNIYSDYTVDELEQQKKKLEKDYAHFVDYPYLRMDIAERIKYILELLNWHYDQDGTREYLESKEKTRKELLEFDQKYATALREAGR